MRITFFLRLNTFSIFFSLLIFCSLSAHSGEKCGSDNFGLKQIACEADFYTHDCATLKETMPAEEQHLIKDCSIKSHVDNDADNLITIADCVGAFGESLKDLVLAPFSLMAWLGTPSQASAQHKMQLALAEKCQTAECKRGMLGDYASLFSKDEIEGNPPPGTDCRDIVNGNLCNGLSLAVMVRQAPNRLQELRMRSSTQLADFIPPWGKTEQINIAEMKDKILDGFFQKAHCYSPEAQNEMACYGAFIIIDPIAAVGLASKLRKAGKFRLQGSTLGSKVNEICDFCKLEKLTDGAARHISVRHLASAFPTRTEVWTAIKSGTKYSDLPSEHRQHINILTKKAPHTTLFPPYVDVENLQDSIRKMPSTKVKPTGDVDAAGVALHRGTVEIAGNNFVVEMWVCRSKQPCIKEGGKSLQPNEIATIYPVCGDGVVSFKKDKANKISVNMANCMVAN